MARNLAIIDIQQLFLASREEFGPLARLDFVKLKSLFRTVDTDIVDPIAYILASPYHDDKNFIRFLKKHGYIIMRKFAQLDVPRSSGEDAHITFKNKSWIESMIWDTIKLVPTYDNFFIVSGNGQFCSVVNAAHEKNKHVTVISFRSCLQETLKTKADKVVLLDKEFIFDSSVFNAKKELAARAANG